MSKYKFCKSFVKDIGFLYEPWNWFLEIQAQTANKKRERLCQANTDDNKQKALEGRKNHSFRYIVF